MLYKEDAVKTTAPNFFINAQVVWLILEDAASATTAKKDKYKND